MIEELSYVYESKSGDTRLLEIQMKKNKKIIKVRGMSFFDFLGNIGGVFEIFVWLFGYIFVPISEQGYFLKMIK